MLITLCVLGYMLVGAYPAYWFHWRYMAPWERGSFAMGMCVLGWPFIVLILSVQLLGWLVLKVTDLLS